MVIRGNDHIEDYIGPTSADPGGPMYDLNL